MKGNVKMFVSDKYQEKKNNPIKTHFLFFKEGSRHAFSATNLPEGYRWQKEGVKSQPPTHSFH